MKKTILYIILLISVSFNIAFIVSTVIHIKNRPPLPGPEGFEFKGDRRPAHFNRMMDEGREDAKKRMRDFRKLKKEFMEELMSPEFTPERAEEIFQKGLKAQIEMEKKISEHLMKIRTEMSDEEAKECFKRKIHERKNRRRNRK